MSCVVASCRRPLHELRSAQRERLDLGRGSDRPPGDRELHGIHGGLGHEGDVRFLGEEDAAREERVREHGAGVGVAGFRERRFAWTVTIRGEPGRERAGALHVVAEHHGAEDDAVFAVLSPVEGLGRDTEELGSFPDVSTVGECDVHHVSRSALRLCAACALVPGDAEDDALLDARQLLRALEGGRELGEALSRERARAVLDDAGAVRLDGVDEGELGGDAGGVRRVEGVLHRLVEHEAQQDDEKGERHEAHEFAEAHLLLLLPFFSRNGFGSAAVLILSTNSVRLQAARTSSASFEVV